MKTRKEKAQKIYSTPYIFIGLNYMKKIQAHVSVIYLLGLNFKLLSSKK